MKQFFKSMLIILLLPNIAAVRFSTRVNMDDFLCLTMRK